MRGELKEEERLRKDEDTREKRFRKGAELRGPEECAELAQGAEG
jgi:hypothetical protein